MRMDQSTGRVPLISSTIAEPEELVRIFRLYGEEPAANARGSPPSSAPAGILSLTTR